MELESISVTPAKQEITGCANQGGRADTDPGHFIGTHAAMFAVMSKGTIRHENNNKAGQEQELFQG